MSTNICLKGAPAMQTIMRRFHPVRLIQTPHLIRFRLTLWYTGLAALVLATFVGSVFYAFSHYQFDGIDQQAKDALQKTFTQQVKAQVVDQCAGDTVVQGSPNPYAAADACYAVKLQINDPGALDTPYSSIRYLTLNGKPLPASDNRSPHEASSSALLNKDRTVNNAVKAVQKGQGANVVKSDISSQFRVITMPLTTSNGDRVIGQIVYRMNRVERQVDLLKRILVYIAAVLLLISAVGGWILSGRALKPVDEITRRARQITANDLSQRLGIKQEDELGRMAATFDDMIGRLEEAFERQKRFASDASHELRTPLTVMQSEVSLALARPRSSNEYRETLVSMDEEVSRLSTIVGDLLTLTRVDIDPAGIQHKPVALDELLESLSARVGVIAAERDIAVRAERLDPVSVAGDPTRLRQLFTNLLDNAVNYTRDGGRVTVTVERTAEGARVRVADTGIGIAAVDLPHIFERFYRADGAREQNAQGTGLGLAISRSVALAHHGHIDVVSELGAGTTFIVVLPVDSRKPVHRVVPWRVPALVASK